MSRMKLIFILLSTLASLNALANNSLTWQKLSLEDKLQRKYDAVMSTSLKENQYMTEVEVEVAEPGAPNFGDDEDNTGPKISDLSLDESRGDYIAFSKVGLEMPVVDKFMDEDKVKLLNLYRYNESFDLFKNISSIDVTIYLSDKLPPELVDIIQKMVTSTKIQVAGIKPRIKFETLAMEWIPPEEKKPEKKIDATDGAGKAAAADAAKKVSEEKEPKIWTKDWLEWASRWGNGVGLILGSMIISIIAFILFKKWQDLMERLAARAAEANKVEEKDDDEGATNKTQLSEDQAKSAEEEIMAAQGFERFQQCLAQHSIEAINIIKAWLNEGSSEQVAALQAIAQQSSREEMEQLLAGLTQSQRDRWKSLLSTHLSQAEVLNANKYVFQEVVKSLLVPTMIKDNEIMNMVMEMNLPGTVQFLDENPASVGVMMNILNPNIVTKVLADVEEKKADIWLLEGASFKFDFMDDELKSLKENLIKFRERNLRSPFASKIMAMIQTAQPAREGSLYRVLAKAGGQSMVLEVARKIFPNELVMKLPVNILRDVLQSYPVAKRVDLLYSMEESQRNKLIDSLAEPGTTARDLIDMELENVLVDEARKTRIESTSSEIWGEFVNAVRVALANNSSYHRTVDKLVFDWSKRLAGIQVVKGGKVA